MGLYISISAEDMFSKIGSTNIYICECIFLQSVPSFVSMLTLTLSGEFKSLPFRYIETFALKLIVSLWL